MFPKGTVTAAVVTSAEKPPFTAQKESTVVYMVDNTDPQADAVNHPYWRIQRARICACAVVLTTLILVAGALGGIAIVLRHTDRVDTMDPRPSLNHDRESLLSNEVPLPKLPESTIRIKIDDGGLWPPTEPANPDLTASDGVTDDITKPLPTIALSTTRIKMGDGGSLPSTEPATPDLIANHDVTDDPAIELLPTMSSVASFLLPERDETDVEVSGDNQENVDGSGEHYLDTYYDGRVHSMVWFDSYNSYIIPQRG